MADKYADKRVGHGNRSCYKADGTRKLRYDKEVAMNAAAKLRELGDNVHHYVCDVCGHFHVGRTKNVL